MHIFVIEIRNLKIFRNKNFWWKLPFKLFGNAHSSKPLANQKVVKLLLFSFKVYKLLTFTQN